MYIMFWVTAHLPKTLLKRTFNQLRNYLRFHDPARTFNKLMVVEKLKPRSVDCFLMAQKIKVSKQNDYWKIIQRIQHFKTKRFTPPPPHPTPEKEKKKKVS